MAETRPVRLLIAALGGEGGGVLAGWITEAAIASGHATSRTSIPGVAQRTGATTYYIEIVRDGGSLTTRPILSLSPAPGEVDVFVASELLEAARAVQNGMVSPDRTVVVVSTGRVLTIAEKSDGGDGRVDNEQLSAILRQFAERAILADFGAAARAANAPLNAVLLGALAATGAIAITADAFRTAIRNEGKSVTANLAGFDAGLTLAAPKGLATIAPITPAAIAEPPGHDLLAFPHEARETIAEGVRRLADYQDKDYAHLFLRRIRRFDGRPGVNGEFLAVLARNLAVRMSVEDVIRVAELKLREARVARVTAEARARPGDIVDITEYLKPGPEEILGLFAPWYAHKLMGFASRRGWMDKSWPLKITTTRTSGYLRLKLLAGMKQRRRKTYKFEFENDWVERWLDLVEATLAVDTAAAKEVADTAGLVTGYGETYKRGLGAYQRIANNLVAPGIEGRMPRHIFADAILQARLAAKKDPEGDSLAQTLAAIHAQVGGPRLAAV